jgi:hypothetical protein
MAITDKKTINHRNMNIIDKGATNHQNMTITEQENKQSSKHEHHRQENNQASEQTHTTTNKHTKKNPLFGGYISRQNVTNFYLYVTNNVTNST